jgi:type VI protein secretion system component VasK
MPSFVDSVVQFFGPAGAAFAFFDTTLKEDFERSSDEIKVKPNTKVERQVIDFYQKAFLVRGSLFPGGVESIARDFQVRPQGITKQPDSTVKASGVTLEIGGEKRTYRFGPEETWTFKWPGQIGRARLSLDGANEAIETWGDWALFRLIDKGSVKPMSGGWIEVRFDFKQGQVQVPLQIRPATGSLNPLSEQRKFKISCPRPQPK